MQFWCDLSICLMITIWVLIQYKDDILRYRKSHCGDKTVVRSSYLHNGISFTGKMTSLYWISAQRFTYFCYIRLLIYSNSDVWKTNVVKLSSKRSSPSLSTERYLKWLMFPFTHIVPKKVTLTWRNVADTMTAITNTICGIKLYSWTHLTSWKARNLIKNDVLLNNLY